MTSTELHLLLKQKTKYSRLYLSIIFKAKSEDRIKITKGTEGYIYFEKHHILPKSIFPKYKDLKEYSWNSILLTPKEHFICHILIWKHYKKIECIREERKMSKALRMMNYNGEYNSNNYTYFKLNLKHSKETIQKIKEKRKLQAPMSDSTKVKCGLASKGSKWVNNKRVFNSNEESSRDCEWKKGKITVYVISENKYKDVTSSEYNTNKHLYKSLGGRKEGTVGSTMVYNYQGEKIRVTLEEKEKFGYMSINSGELNGRALHLELYNEKGVIVGIKEKSEKIKSFCKRFEICEDECRKSYLNNRPFQKSKRSKYFSKNGWYVIKAT